MLGKFGMYTGRGDVSYITYTELKKPGAVTQSDAGQHNMRTVSRVQSSRPTTFFRGDWS